MQPAPVNKKFVTSLVVIVGLAVILFVAAVVISNGKKTIPASDFVSKQNNSVVHASWLPAFTGMSVLTDHGLSSDQLTAVEYEFGLFSKTLPSSNHTVKVNEVSARNAPISRDPSNINTAQYFDVSVDSVPYHATISYTIMTPDISLKLVNYAGATVYQSAAININTQNPAP